MPLSVVTLTGEKLYAQADKIFKCRLPQGSLRFFFYSVVFILLISAYTCKAVGLLFTPSFDFAYNKINTRSGGGDSQ